jgi:hypothetical protein
VNLDRAELEDVAHRVLWTFLESFSGFMLAAEVATFDLTLLESAAGAGLAAVLTVVKEYGRRRLADSPKL